MCEDFVESIMEPRSRNFASESVKGSTTHHPSVRTRVVHTLQSHWYCFVLVCVRESQSGPPSVSLVIGRRRTAYPFRTTRKGTCIYVRTHTNRRSHVHTPHTLTYTHTCTHTLTSIYMNSNNCCCVDGTTNTG
eukprot:GHVS01007727.1.p1 GENE.GHVS01007727.1~~GHVS01007727.1.p1  ORF type:complete len:133 (+),score=8.56 GHVS01007727.1:147-545(+)